MAKKDKKEVVIYSTNAGLGYQEFAFLLLLEKGEAGFNTYLCIGTQFLEHDAYIIGETTELHENHVEVDTFFKIEKSPLYRNYLILKNAIENQ